MGGAGFGIEDPDGLDAHVEEVLDTLAHGFEGVAGRLRRRGVEDG